MSATRKKKENPSLTKDREEKKKEFLLPSGMRIASGNLCDMNFYLWKIKGSNNKKWDDKRVTTVELFDDESLIECDIFQRNSKRINKQRATKKAMRNQMMARIQLLLARGDHFLRL